MACAVIKESHLKKKIPWTLPQLHSEASLLAASSWGEVLPSVFSWGLCKVTWQELSYLFSNSAQSALRHPLSMSSASPLKSMGSSLRTTSLLSATIGIPGIWLYLWNIAQKLTAVYLSKKPLSWFGIHPKRVFRQIYFQTKTPSVERFLGASQGHSLL